MLSLGVGFDGLDWTSNAAPLSPPDPIGAVGPNSVVDAVNVAVAIYDKTGQILKTPNPGGGTPLDVRSSFASFFSLLGDTATSIFTDPVVVYNENTGQFAVGVVDFHRDAMGQAMDSRFDFAVSKTSDPRTLTEADWTFARYDVDDDLNAPSGSNFNVNFGRFPETRL